jgi:hypothetical protein
LSFVIAGAAQRFSNDIGLLFDPHAHAYNPFNSQRYTLMAEDAVESAGAKAPAITISIQQFIAGLEVLCHQTIDVPRFIPNSESGASEWQTLRWPGD